MSEVSSLDLNIDNNEITNIADLIEILNNSELNEEMVNHIRTLNNKLSSMNLTNKAELLQILSSKIMEFESKQQENINNQEALRVLKSINEDFQKLNIISTKREDNDSDKYIDYLTFTNENGEVEMLSCDSGESINSFIQANADKLPGMTASDIFRHFKEYVHREVEFSSPEDMKNNPDKRKQAVVNDPEIEKQELEEVESYKNKYGIQQEVEVAIDNNGERIYRIGDGVIKFRTSNSERIMQVLKQPTITQTATYDDMLAELDDEPSLTPVEIEVKNTQKGVSGDSYSSLETINDEYFNSARLDEIVARRDVYDLELTYEEEHELNLYAKHLLEHMKTNVEANLPVDEKTELAANFMESARGEKASIIDTYNAIQEGREPEGNLSDIEKEFAKIYIENKEKMKSLGLDKTVDKKRILEMQNQQQAGITTIIVLLELITLAMFILMFLRLDI